MPTSPTEFFALKASEFRADRKHVPRPVLDWLKRYAEDERHWASGAENAHTAIYHAGREALLREIIMVILGEKE